MKIAIYKFTKVKYEYGFFYTCKRMDQSRGVHSFEVQENLFPYVGEGSPKIQLYKVDLPKVYQVYEYDSSINRKFLDYGDVFYILHQKCKKVTIDDYLEANKFLNDLLNKNS